MINRSVIGLLYEEDFIQQSEDTICIKTNIEGRYLILQFYRDDNCTMSIGNIFHNVEIWDNQECDFYVEDLRELYKIVCKKELKLKHETYEDQRTINLLNNGK